VSDLPFHRVLVANRGEIALRVIRTLRALGLSSVAVYSDADAEHPHVLEADEAVRLGPPEPRASYLDVGAVIDAAKSSGAEAVHPGYGFLSENAAFAAACADAGLVFVGPGADVLEGSADKVAVKRKVAKAGVPVIPGPLGPVASDARSLRAAGEEAGFPLLLKAAGGGGGKGMRRVDQAAGLVAAAEAAAREAAGAFGRPELYVERFVERARHVEVQVLADDQGTVAVLGERDCSLQRRHQKIVEEAPAPRLPDATREALFLAARRATEALGYRNAGTVEFLLDDEGEFWFLEMNRRLQVEHPVTEAVLGIDLVAWQLRLAAGQALDPARPFAPRGHAIEARVYAEDPANGFLPSVGTILALREPEGPGVRVDAALETGLEVTPWYDPLLAKVIAHGETREEALRRLDLALRETVILGLRTNVAFLRRALAHPAFREGGFTTDLLDRDGAVLGEAGEVPAAVLLAAAAHALLPGEGSNEGGARGRRALPSPWESLEGFRLSGGAS
jgi:acetyl-CoA/propionyl-CoA carboxylase biotin carboxyl carrier protein